MKQFSIAMILVASVLGGCATSTSQAKINEAMANPSQLAEQRHSNFDSLTVQKQLQDSGLKRIFFAELGLEETVINQPSKIANGLRNKFALTEKDKIGLSTLFNSSIARYFSIENGFITVDDPDDADMIITADILKMQPTAPKDDIKSRSMNTRFYTEGSGSMTVEFNVYENEQFVMKIEDSRDAGRLWGQNMKLNNKQNVKTLFKAWARDLAEVLS